MADVEVPASQASDLTASQRRRSGRAIRAPERFIAEPDSSQIGSRSQKRKRTNGENDDIAEEDEELEDEEMVEDSQPESDEEAPVKKKFKTKAAPKKAAAPKKPVAPRAPKSMSLPNRPKKAAVGKVVLKDADAEGVYAEIFTSGKTSDIVATEWLATFDSDNTAALTDLINMVLKAAGCDIKVTEDDINDPDNVPSRLEDIQEAHKDHTTVEYPIVAKAKAANAHAFKAALTGFFISLITVMRETGILYDDVALIENITVWITTMSSSSLRPFRHTATVIALALTVALCHAVKAEVEGIAAANKMLEKEKATKKPNEGRVTAFEKKVEDGRTHRDASQQSISEFFDAVFVHRYRDLDPRIRADCVEALGDWVILLPATFYDGSYLRYLGWELSDLVGHVRHEVLLQIKKITKRGEISGISTFIERFRPRIIEMATLDAETNCRAAALELLDVIREKGMLEPDDIDVIGKLIFDSDAKVRKAVVPFFGAIIDDLYESKVEEVGGEEGLEDVFSLDDENKGNPSAGWIKLKSLGESLYSYGNEGLEDGEEPVENSSKLLHGLVNVADFKSRYELAAEVLYDKIDELQDWEMIIGYLLYDHTNIKEQGSLTVAIQNAFKLEENEEVVLLDILHSSIESSLARLGDEHGHKKRGRAADDVVAEATRHLAATLPKLMKRFGSNPKTAAAVLRLVRLLPQQSHQVSSEYKALLHEIRSQFKSHADDSVLKEASRAMLYAHNFEDMEETVEEEEHSSWVDAIDDFRKRYRNTEGVSVRGDMKVERLKTLTTAVTRLHHLAEISSSIEHFEKIPTKANASLRISSMAIIDILLEISARGYLQTPDDEIDDHEDKLVMAADAALRMYFMWKANDIASSIKSGESLSATWISTMKTRLEAFHNALILTISSRAGHDLCRLDATGALLETYVLFYVVLIPHQEQLAGGELLNLLYAVDEDLLTEITSIFATAEKNYAKKAGKRLEAPADDDEPEDLDSDSESEETPVVGDKSAGALRAEQQLCTLTAKLVLALSCGVIPDGKSTDKAGRFRARVLRNRNKLGHNMSRILAHLDAKAKPKKKAPVKRVAATTGNEKSKERVEESDSEMSEIEDVVDEDEERLRELLANEEDPVVDDEEAAEAPEDVEMLGD